MLILILTVKPNREFSNYLELFSVISKFIEKRKMNSLQSVYLFLFICAGSVFSDAPTSGGPTVSARNPALAEVQYTSEDESEPTYTISQQVQCFKQTGISRRLFVQ